MKHALRMLGLAAAFLTLASCGEDESGRTCGPANCMGCCTAAGQCIPSPDTTNCGMNGSICMACPLGTQCVGGICKQSVSSCSPANCSGCCDSKGKCSTPISNTACGSPGGPCVDCTQQQQTCSAIERRCVTGGSCIPSCTSKCAGANDGCGGTCQVNDCKVGCCLSGQCVAGKSDYACGADGSSCANCTEKSTTCLTETGKCANCTSDCAGKCAGAGDGCGGTCPTSQCSGCCTKESNPRCLPGAANDACGSGGGECTDCTEKNTTCSGGSCSGCTRNCTGKCAGASDGCGGTCTTNQCTGCCTDDSSHQCLGGTANTACGSGGATCEVCPSDFQGYSWICDATKTCIKDTPLSIDCASQPDGTAGCTNNGVTGVCYNGSCCTGCYNAISGYCMPYPWDVYCGKNGATCTDCTFTNKVCENGACVIPEGPCGGLADNAPCTDGGLSGRCMSGYCCTGCFDDSSGITTCYTGSSITADHCGTGGSGCISCEDYQLCSSSGSCLTDLNAQVVMTVASAWILENKDWDDYSSSWSAPDPGVCLWWDNASCGSATAPMFSSDACTHEEEDTYYPGWLYDLPVKTLGELIAGDTCLQLLDWDVAGAYDLIGTCQVNITLSDVKAGYLTLWGCPHPTQGDYVDFLHFSFWPAP